jgi:hypothetical protein
MKKIYEDQKRAVNKAKQIKNSRKRIKALYVVAYSCIDMLITFDHMYQLLSDIFSTPELRDRFDSSMKQMVGDSRKIAKKWKPVRNRLGGHIDIEVVENLCLKHNFIGVFLSDDLEADVPVLNMLLIENAVNYVRDKSDIFGRDLDFKNNGLANEMKLFVDTLNKDWNAVYEYFRPMSEFLYKHGKEEKMRATHPEDRKGLVVG